MVLLHLSVIRGRSAISRVAAPSWSGTLCCEISNKNADSEAENGNGSGFRVCQALPDFQPKILR